MSASDISDLRRKLAALHGDLRAEWAVNLALYTAALGVYREACRRSSIAEDALHTAIAGHHAARETEDEWLAIVHGQALQVARDIDVGAGRKPGGHVVSHTYDPYAGR